MSYFEGDPRSILAKEVIVKSYEINREKMKALRFELGLSRAELAKRIGISTVYYWELETGRKKRCSPLVLERICKELLKGDL